MKTAAEWDRQEVGNLQLDYVLHCGRSTAGEYRVTLSAADTATGCHPELNPLCAAAVVHRRTT